MAPEQVLNQTLTHVRKILKSPGCRKTPVFVDSIEKAVELSQTFAAERFVVVIGADDHNSANIDGTGYARSSSYPMSLDKALISFVPF